MEKLTAKRMAEILNRRQYRDEITKEQEEAAKASGLVVIFGASDDLLEIRGAVYEELGVWSGGDVYFNEDGLLQNECENDQCPHFDKMMYEAVKVSALWCVDKESPSWTYKTKIKHETFEILEDDEVYCRGIVFSMDDIKNALPENK